MKADPVLAAEAFIQVLPPLMRFLHWGAQDHLLTLPQLSVLAALRDGERSAGEVAADLGIRPSTLTGLVSPLHRQGLITRRRDPVAWRVVLLGLSAAGHDVYRTVRAATRQRLSALLAGLAPADQVALVRACTELNQSLGVVGALPPVAAAALNKLPGNAGARAHRVAGGSFCGAD